MRRNDRQITDLSRIESILNGAKYLHLGLFDEEFPYVVPMHYGYRCENGRLTFYVHCAEQGHKLECLRKNNRVLLEIDRQLSLIPAESPCGYGAEYECFMGRGTAAVVENLSEKQQALALLLRLQTGRSFEISQAMAAGVTVLRIDVISYSAKARVR